MEPLSSRLAGFTGTTQYYSHPLARSFRYTDGIKALADIAGAYWLLDLVASYIPHMRQNEEIWDFSLWTITLNSDGPAPDCAEHVESSSAVVTCQADIDAPIFIEQEIPYTNFPENYSWYVSEGIMMLKSEY